MVFLIGMSLAVLAPLLGRFKMASPALAVGALATLAVALFGLAYPDVRSGQASIEANRRFYLTVLACGFPAFILALVSWKRFRWAFWLGWAVNLAFVLYLLVVVVWLEFFWHW